MYLTLARAVAFTAASFILSPALAGASGYLQTEASGAQPNPAPKPAPTATPNPLALSGIFRYLYYTRQNASNNPGVQCAVVTSTGCAPNVFPFPKGAKYNSNAVNQATGSGSLALHADYHFADFPGWYAGATYYFANPLSGPCSVAANHTASGAAASSVKPPCTQQLPPNTNPDDTVPGFAIDTFAETYVGYAGTEFSGKLGDQVFTSPWASPADTRRKPATFQGIDVAYAATARWSFEGADMIQYENRTSADFSRSTLLTSYPSGAAGLPSNIYVPCHAGQCIGIPTGGFGYGKAGYAVAGFSADAYYYDVYDLTRIWWLDAKFALGNGPWRPYVALQGGTNDNGGASYLGKIDSDVAGIQLGANPSREVLVTLGFDTIPWKSATIDLPKGVTCSSTGPVPTHQFKIAAGTSLLYFLPSNAGECVAGPNGTATIYYGGWASPYTDSYASDPLFTTSITQGMVDRRAAGTSLKLTATYTSRNNRVTFLASDAWYDYGNAAAAQTSNEWDLDGIYRFSPYKGSGPYRGVLVRDRFMTRMQSNTYYPGGTIASCTPGVPCPELGGLPLFKYNRFILEDDF